MAAVPADRRRCGAAAHRQYWQRRRLTDAEPGAIAPASFGIRHSNTPFVTVSRRRRQPTVPRPTVMWPRSAYDFGGSIHVADRRQPIDRGSSPLERSDPEHPAPAAATWHQRARSQGSLTTILRRAGHNWSIQFPAPGHNQGRPHALESATPWVPRCRNSTILGAAIENARDHATGRPARSPARYRPRRFETSSEARSSPDRARRVCGRSTTPAHLALEIDNPQTSGFVGAIWANRVMRLGPTEPINAGAGWRIPRNGACNSRRSTGPRIAASPTGRAQRCGPAASGRHAWPDLARMVPDTGVSLEAPPPRRSARMSFGETSR